LPFIHQHPINTCSDTPVRPESNVLDSRQSFIYLVTIYNGLVAIKNDIDKAWANIDVLLKQGHDELSKLLDVTKGYSNFERETLTKITQARSQYSTALTFDQKARADQSMTSALRGFFAVAENYPELKANSNFMELEQRITALENQIADRREFYNDSVNTFNIRIQQVPDTFVAAFMRLTPRTMLQIGDAEKTDVQMSFAQGQ
jgi:LemA protein